jgi:alanine racemase
MQYRIDEIAKILKADRHGSADTVVNWLLTDSRSLCFPEETLFFAFKTQRNDGHKYIDELYRRGVRSFVVEQEPADYQTRFPEGNFLKVSSLAQRLLLVASKLAKLLLLTNTPSVVM